MKNHEPAKQALANFEDLLGEVAKEVGGAVIGMSIVPRPVPAESLNSDERDNPWRVWVVDNFRAPGEDGGSWDLGRFKSSEEALAAAREVIDEFLEANFEPGAKAGHLVTNWILHGYGAYVSPEPEPPFRSMEYCRRRAEEMCASSAGS